MINFYCSDSNFENLLADYWNCEDYENFTYTQKYLIEKYKLKNEKKLDSLIIKSGYGFICEKGFLCTCCNQPYHFETRKEFKHFVEYYCLRFKVVCRICKRKQEEDYFKKGYIDAMEMALKFNKIYMVNYKQKYNGDFFHNLNELNYLELIYLHLILNETKYQPAGKISNNKKFYLFLHQEFYEENMLLEKLYNYGLLFYTKDFSLFDYISRVRRELGFGFNVLTQRSEVTDKILKDFNKMNLDLFNVILKPSPYSFKDYRELIIRKIYDYNLDFNSWVGLTNFFKFLRKKEILFLADVIEYNNEFRLKKNNAIDNKINLLQENYNLRKIYNFFDNSVDQALTVLENYSNREIFLIKNLIYNKILISDKNKFIYEKNLPRNYNKSNFVKFFEERYELGDIWEEVSVNEFIRILFDKMKSLGVVNFD